jgi:hypothetical protein
VSLDPKLAEKVFATLADRAPDKDAPIKPLGAALLDLFARDGLLLQINAHERSVCHHLAVHLERHFPGLNIDCEYNRLRYDIKRIPDFDGAGRRSMRRVFPDIVVHRRLEHSDNLLIIEMKLTTSRGSDADDLAKLSFYRAGENYRYRYAVFIKLLAGSAELGLAQVIWIK